MREVQSRIEERLRAEIVLVGHKCSSRARQVMQLVYAWWRK